MVLGLNFALGDPTARPATPRLSQRDGPRRLAAFEVGNEPDRYGQPHMFHVGPAHGHAAQRRSDSYSFQRLPRASSEASLPPYPPARRATGFAAGAFAGGGWDSHTDALLARAEPAVRAFSCTQLRRPSLRRRRRRRTKASLRGRCWPPAARADRRPHAPSGGRRHRARHDVPRDGGELCQLRRRRRRQQRVRVGAVGNRPALRSCAGARSERRLPRLDRRQLLAGRRPPRRRPHAGSRAADALRDAPVQPGDAGGCAGCCPSPETRPHRRRRRGPPSTAPAPGASSCSTRIRRARASCGSVCRAPPAGRVSSVSWRRRCCRARASRSPARRLAGPQPTDD